MSIAEDTLVAWSKGPGTTESQKCENAETAIRKAIAADQALSRLNISVFSQGSYRVRTNIRQDSDVDICVRFNQSFFDDYPAGKTRADFGNVDGSFPFRDFKNLVQSALESYFGTSSVTRGDKAFDIHANTYRIDADVVPTFEYRWYTGRLNLAQGHHYHSGVSFYTDGGHQIINWPQQTYDNGVSKNDSTGRKYKRVIRILKRMRNRMQDDGIVDASNIASFLIESLVWNAPVEAFGYDNYTAILRRVLADLWKRTRQDEDCSEWGEVNELKYLFRPSQPWTRQQANKFLEAAWSFVGYT